MKKVAGIVLLFKLMAVSGMVFAFGSPWETSSYPLGQNDFYSDVIIENRDLSEKIVF